MSTSDLYRVFKTRARHYREFYNGWGSAPPLWGHLCRTHLHREWSPMRDNKDLWALSADDRVAYPLRLALLWTCDFTYCPSERVGVLADACEKVGDATMGEEGANHWHGFAAALREHKPVARQVGVALSCTSVSDIWCNWRGEPLARSVFAVAQRKAK